MAYDPKACGARCDRCLLATKNVGGPVVIEEHYGAEFLVVGESPGVEEVKVSIPFVGPSGRELMKALGRSGVSRTNVSLTNACLCRPPADMMEKIKVETDKINKLHPLDTPLLQPWEACRPRLLNEVRRYKNVLALGGTALKSLMGAADAKIMAMRGAPLTLNVMPNDLTYVVSDVNKAPVLSTFEGSGTDFTLNLFGPEGTPWTIETTPTIHPAHALRQQRYLKVLISDISHAIARFRGVDVFVEPTKIFAPTAAQVRKFLREDRPPFYVVDVETDSKYALRARLRCIGISTTDFGMVIPVLSIDGVSSPWYTDAEAQEIMAFVREFLVDRSRLKVGHNCLRGTVRVCMADGTTQPIQKLVAARSSSPVLGVDESGQIVAAQVNDWIRNVQVGQEWVAVTLAGQKPNSAGLTVTPDHEIYTTRGRVRADRIRVGDEVLTAESKLPSDVYAALLGTCVGDASLKVSPTRRGRADSATARVIGSHTNRALTEEKIRWARPWLSDCSNGPGVFGFKTKTTRQLGSMRSYLYPEGRRDLPVDLLDRLGPVGLAWWYMDDGCLVRRTDETRQKSVQLALCRYPRRAAEELVNQLKIRFDGHVHLDRVGVAWMAVEPSARFLEYVAPWVLPAARYKLPAELAQRVPACWPKWKLEPYAVPVTGASPLMRTDADKDVSYCLTTSTGNFLTTQGLVKNCGYYDKINLMAQLGVEIVPVIDTLLVHRAVDGELPHGLDFVASMHTTVPRAWKSDHTATQAKSDQELHEYNLMDCILNARVVAPLLKGAEMRGQIDVLKLDHEVQKICVGLHCVGLPVDFARRDERDKQSLYGEPKPKLTQADVDAWPNMYKMGAGGMVYRKGLLDFLADCRLNSGDPEFMPGSYPRVGKLLFDTWRYEPEDFTDGGMPKTDDGVLLKLLAKKTTKPHHKAFIEALRWYRKIAKERGTYILKLKRMDQPIDPKDEALSEDDDDIEVREQRRDPGRAKRVKEIRMGCVSMDGILHTGWNSHTAVSGRLSSSDPINCFDAQTELLTESGWVPFPTYIANEQRARCAQWHENGTIDFVDPSALIAKPFTGSMVSIKNQHTDLRVTEDHRCLLRWRTPGCRPHLKVRAAIDYPVNNMAVEQVHAGSYVGGPGLDLSDDELRLLVATQADGCYHEAGGLDFGFSKQRKIDRLHQLLKSAEVEFTEKAGRFYVNRVNAEWIRSWLGPSKTFGAWLLQLTRAQLRVVCDELWHWDGCFTRKNHYSSSIKSNADWAQAILTLTGQRARLRVYQGTRNPNWQVDRVDRDWSKTVNAKKVIESVTNEMVYCVSVPSSYVVVRRGGCVMVTGQCQNFPKHLRDMIRALDGYEFVGADMDQLEFRFVVGLARASRLLDVFDKIYKKRKAGHTIDKLNPVEDPYSMVAAEIFKSEWDKIGEKDKDRLRTFAKIFTLASIYGAEPITKWDILRSSEDKSGRLVYLNLTKRQVMERHIAWCAANKEIVAWWEDVFSEYRRQGYLLDPVIGRRRDFTDGEENVYNEVLNWKAQTGGAALVHQATLRLINGPIPFYKWGPHSGLCHQGHDALVFQVPKGMGAKLLPQIEEAMESRVKGLDIVFTASGKVGQTLAEV